MTEPVRPPSDQPVGESAGGRDGGPASEPTNVRPVGEAAREAGEVVADEAAATATPEPRPAAAPPGPKESPTAAEPQDAAGRPDPQRVARRGSSRARTRRARLVQRLPRLGRGGFARSRRRGQGARWARRLPRVRLGRRGEAALFVAPALVLFLVFVLLPIGQAGYYSLFNWNGIEDLTDYIGLGNYRRALGEPAFRSAIWHNTIVVVLSLAVQGPLALGLSLLLNMKLRGQAALRAIYFAPYVISEVVTGVIWLLMLQPDGLVDASMRVVGMDGLVQLWLADREIVLYTLFVVITWKYIGFAILLFLAGLQAIPAELYEAAAIDGASYWQTVRHVTVPLLGPTIRTWGFLTIIGSIQLFDLVWIMTLGGPANASNTMAVYMIDRGFERGQYGYGSAVAVMLFAVALICSLLYQRFVLRRDVQGALTGMVR